jgi:SAM-dependent methyltransferase
MSLEQELDALAAASPEAAHDLLDRHFLPFDRECIRRTRNLRLIPHRAERIGGKRAYAEWAHVVGIFQTLIYQNLGRKEDNRILDVGCGTGLLAIACEPALGKYTGIDVGRREIDFCRRHYPGDRFEFLHLDASNASYAPAQDPGRKPWPLAGGEFDLVTALSVWTHFREEDSVHYLGEAARVLKPGGRAIVTFFLLDGDYEASLAIREDAEGRHHGTKQTDWVFDRPAYGSSDWFCPAWARVPEEAIGLTPRGLERLLEASGLSLAQVYPGNWKERPGIFFQDVLVFEKPAA